MKALYAALVVCLIVSKDVCGFPSILAGKWANSDTLGMQRRIRADGGADWSTGAGSSDFETDILDISLTGSCASDIVHHCAHVLKVSDLLTLKRQASKAAAAAAKSIEEGSSSVTAASSTKAKGKAKRVPDREDESAEVTGSSDSLSIASQSSRSSASRSRAGSVKAKANIARQADDDDVKAVVPKAGGKTSAAGTSSGKGSLTEQSESEDADTSASESDVAQGSKAKAKDVARARQAGRTDSASGESSVNSSNDQAGVVSAGSISAQTGEAAQKAEDHAESVAESSEKAGVQSEATADDSTSDKSGVDENGEAGSADAARLRRALLVSGTGDSEASARYASRGGARSSGKAARSAGAEGSAYANGILQEGSSSSSGSSSGRGFVYHEVNAMSKEQTDVADVLNRLGMNPSIPIAQLSEANAPIARCLQSVLRHADLSISPSITSLQDECKAELRTFMIQRASDVRNDPPLIAACAHDISNLCAYVDDPTRVFGCLKQNRHLLQPLCRSAVTQRQAAAAEDIALDPDMNRECEEDRNRLCVTAGWGEGSAQECLLGHMLRGVADEMYSTLQLNDMFEASLMAGDEAEDFNTWSRLSPGCQTSLFQRLLEEAEDIRLNYRLASACTLDKQLLCPTIKPGNAAVQICLEHHMGSSAMTDGCMYALGHQRLLRSLDARLDHAFVAACSADVKSLCDLTTYNNLRSDATMAPLGAGNAAMECLRGQMDLVRSAQCRSVVFSRVVAAYKDNRLDPVLMANCSAETRLLCRSPTNALTCLRDQMREDAALEPGTMGALSSECSSVVQSRVIQASLDLAFNPDLMEACASERDEFCESANLEGSRVLDCLVDHRKEPEFGEKCYRVLTKYLMSAVRDIRTMSGLREDCDQDINLLCAGIKPGEGRVVGCLRDNRANITGALCKRQVLRLLGFVVEDHRMDYELVKACKADVQRLCAGESPGDGRVHDCLRRSAAHLSPECKAAEAKVEAMEHQDVRLNPKIQKECPLAISQFCADVKPGNAEVIRCLQHTMTKPHFPPGCKAVMSQLIDRAQTKYSLNARLIESCTMDVEDYCMDTIDELERHTDNTTLSCLAANAPVLSGPCRSELTALVHVALTRYRMGMPLTSVCDGDVMTRCSVDKLTAPFIERGYIQSCLVKHSSQLHPPCWALISTMDDSQFEHAAELEAQHWQAGGPGGKHSSADHEAREEERLAEVAARLKRELEPKLVYHIEKKVGENVKEATANVTRNVTLAVALQTARHHAWMALQLRPVLNLLGVLVVAVAVLGVYVWKTGVAGRFGIRVVKDGRV